ncbi:TerC family protein [Deinococcus altitudinis]|uniref:TerC family protein n=1 Tax=Deinococcus altitudinis TaxID=468914 RepID=UPI003892298C
MLESFSFAWLTQPEAWLAFATLLLLEIVLGIDNVIFISILAGKLPAALQARARTVGLMGAMVMRVLLLFSVAWIARLTEPLFTVLGHAFSGRDLILLGGGLFLLYKAVTEMHEQLEGPEGHVGGPSKSLSFAAVIGQIMVLDLVFSLDSVITAVGMADDLGVMVSAVVVTVAIMLFAAGPISGFVQKHPTIKMLALAFLLLIGVNLIADGLGLHIPKGYTYFAMGFAIAVELLNLRLRAGKAVALNEKQA